MIKEIDVRKSKIKKEVSDTDSDSDMDLIGKQIEDENILSDNNIETLQNVKIFIEKNNQILIKVRESKDGNKINIKK